MADARPLAATGHLSLRTKDARAAAELLVSVGVRRILVRDRFAVLELRGGTHIVVREAEVDRVQDAPFDLMYDDLDAAHAMFRESGFAVSDIRTASTVHRTFQATAPGRFRVRVFDSHAGGRAV